MREKSLIFDTTNCVPEPVGRFTNTLRPIRNSRTQKNYPSSNGWILNGFKTLSMLSRSNSLVIEATLRRHVLCICNLIILIANHLPLQNLGSLIGTQLVVSNIRLFYRVHSPRARCEESVQASCLHEPG